jgi:hypothetical protein
MLEMVMLLPLLTRLHLGFYQGSYMSAAVLLVGATFQWLLVGHHLDQWLVCKRWGNRASRQIQRWFRLLVAAIVIASLITTSMINSRSRRLGLRHGGVSYGGAGR